MGTANMKVFICLTTVLAAASAAPQYVRPAVYARPAGQVSHQSVSKPYQGELRSTTQSKAFGAGVAAVSDIRAQPGVIAHPVAHAIARPVAVAPAVAVAHPVAHAIAR